jgi:hypothetical protein
MHIYVKLQTEMVTSITNQNNKNHIYVKLQTEVVTSITNQNNKNHIG